MPHTDAGRTVMCMTDNGQDLSEVVSRFLMIAELVLGRRDAAADAVTDALAGALRDPDAHSRNDALRRLLRLCATRAPETEPEQLFSQQSPLAAVPKLTVQGRSDYALLLAEESEDDRAEVLGVSRDALEKRTEKVLRQLVFLQNGNAPDLDGSRAAAAELPLPEEVASVCARLMKAGSAQAESDGTEHTAPLPERILEITRRSTQEPEPSGKPQRGTVSVPVWTLILGAVLILLAGAAGYGLFRNGLHRDNPETESSGEEEPPTPSEVQRAKELNYIGFDGAQEKAAESVGKPADTLVFTSTKLQTDSGSARYEITLLDADAVQYTYVIDAQSGAVFSQNSVQTEEDVPDRTDWIAGPVLRAEAVQAAGADAVLFTKEKLGSESGAYYYKIEFTDAEGKSYTVHLMTQTGMMMKYSVKGPNTADDSALISQEEARRQALARVGAVSEDAVIFTKEKLEGAVWLISLTLDDGTQYTVELNARTGMSNTVDVHPVSADVSDMIGMLRAREIALDFAGLTDSPDVRFTKAKIDRGNASYVYELEFETVSCEYEVTVHAVTGELLKFRAWLL